MTKTNLKHYQGRWYTYVLTLTLKSKGFEVMSNFPFKIYFPLESKYVTHSLRQVKILVNTDDKEI